MVQTKQTNQSHHLVRRGRWGDTEDRQAAEPKDDSLWHRGRRESGAPRPPGADSPSEGMVELVDEVARPRHQSARQTERQQQSRSVNALDLHQPQDSEKIDDTNGQPADRDQPGPARVHGRAGGATAPLLFAVLLALALLVPLLAGKA